VFGFRVSGFGKKGIGSIGRIDRICLIALIVPLPVRTLAAPSADEVHLAALARHDQMDGAVARGLAYLVQKQDPSGHFSKDMPNVHTALSCMALMSAGQIPGRSRYGENLRKGIMYLVDASKSGKGYFGREGNARMYGHGICTLALCEAYGMMQDEGENRLVKEAIERAVKIILASQSKHKGPHHGGWRYEPRPGDADLSVTAWQVLALRAAQNCRLRVPAHAVTDAMNYVRRTYHAGSKGFTYQAGSSSASAAMRSAGTVCMLALGSTHEGKDAEMLNGSAAFLLTAKPGTGRYFYYQSYYLATAANMMGKRQRSFLLPKMEKALLNLQMPSGEFRKHTGAHGGVYSTAFGVICLSVRYQYLPIYQE